MNQLEGRVVVVTGAGRGLGRAHALFLAAHGARVVVNDLGAGLHGDGASDTPAQQVVREIVAAGGEAVASGHDVSDWTGAGELVDLAVDTFGDLHVVVNNAGILRDRTLAAMTEDEWDAVVRVHLKGHAAPTHHAMRYWRARAKAGTPTPAPALVHTSSASGFVGNFGQANYGAAKIGVIALSQIARLEGAGFGLRSNVIGPVAATRMGGEADPAERADFELLDPANVSPLVGWLAAADCPANGQVFHAYGNRVVVLEIPHVAADVRTDGRWTMADLDARITPVLADPPALAGFLPKEAETLRTQIGPAATS